MCRYVRVVAPRNPLIEVATFHFVPAAQSSPRVDAHPPRRAAICLGVCRAKRRHAVDDQNLGRRRYQWLRLSSVSEEDNARPSMPRVQVPSSVTKGEIFQVKALISHQMETGLRHDNEGNVIPRKIINKFVCRYNGVDVFSRRSARGRCRQPVSRVLPARHGKRPA